jgi:RNA:NAD 2'-phosphotransferase (TPT1/KptA family)
MKDRAARVSKFLSPVLRRRPVTFGDEGDRGRA